MAQATRAHEATPVPARTSPVGRIASLDWVRGWFLVGSVATASVLPPRPEQLTHAPWFGLTLEDTVFPLFVTLSGCGLAFAYRNRVGWAATARRSVVLLLCGLLYNAVAAGSLDLTTLRLTGPLQIYSLLVLVIGLLHLVARTARGWSLVTTVVAVGHAAFLAAWQQDCAGQELTRECNPSATIDAVVLGPAHMYAAGAAGHDPEGLVGFLGALLTACVGTTAGHLALSARGTRRAPLLLLGWAAVVAVAALAAGQQLPVMKRLWTTPFALGVAAAGVVLLAMGMLLLDQPAREGWARVRERLAWPQVALGRNSLLVYFGSHLLVLVLLDGGGEPSWAHRAARAVDLVGHPRASFVVAMLVAWGGLAALLHRQRIYLRP